jgi:hypothetical protein
VAAQPTHNWMRVLQGHLLAGGPGCGGADHQGAPAEEVQVMAVTAGPGSMLLTQHSALTEGISHQFGGVRLR